MDRNEIMRVIAELAMCQGFYSGLYANLKSLNADQFDAVMSELEAQNFASTADMVMYLES